METEKQRNSREHFHTLDMSSPGFPPAGGTREERKKAKIDPTKENKLSSSEDSIAISKI